MESIFQTEQSVNIKINILHLLYEKVNLLKKSVHPILIYKFLKSNKINFL